MMISRSRQYIQKVLLVVALVVALIFVVEIFSTFLYLRRTYLQEFSFEPRIRTLKDISKIPPLVHQIYFNINVNGVNLLDKYRFARQSWSKLNPDFQYTLWNKTMVDNLIKFHYPSLYPLYMSYDNYMNQNEVGRYAIVHRYGGIYADLDIECSSNMTAMFMKAFDKKSQVVLHLGDIDLASNDFFAASPRNPFIWHVLDGLVDANRWFVFPYANIMFKTGATYIHGRYRTYPYKGEIMTIPDVNNHIIHHHASSWHHWDGKILIWFYRRGYIVKSIMFLVFLLGILYFYIRYKRRLRSQEKCDKP